MHLFTHRDFSFSLDWHNYEDIRKQKRFEVQDIVVKTLYRHRCDTAHSSIQKRAMHTKESVLY